MIETVFRKKMDERCKVFNKENPHLRMSYAVESGVGFIACHIKLNDIVVYGHKYNLSSHAASLKKGFDALYDAFIDTSNHLAMNAIDGMMRQKAEQIEKIRVEKKRLQKQQEQQEQQNQKEDGKEADSGGNRPQQRERSIVDKAASESE